MIISHSKKFIFFKPIKTAGSSIEWALRKSCNDCDLYTGLDIHDKTSLGINIHSNIGAPLNNKIGKYPLFHMHTSTQQLYKLSSMMNSDWKMYKKVTMVRNPYDMVVSYFWWCTQRINDESTKPYFGDSKLVLQSKFEKRLNQIGKFEDDDEITDDHLQIIQWLSQKTNAFYKDDLDFVIRYEHLNKDYKNVCKLLDIDQKVLTKFKSNIKKSNLKYQDYYNSFTKRLVEHNFKDIINMFDYKFEETI